MWTDELRREARRYSWVIAAVPLAGASLSAVSLTLCTAAAEALLHLDDLLEEDAVKTCLNDDNDTASEADDLCQACLDVEEAGEALPNRRRPETRTG